MKNMRLNKLITRGLIAAVLVLGLSLATISKSYAFFHNPQPTQSQVAFAERTGELMFQTILAALLQEFKETTDANVQEGNHSISLIFNDKNRDMRLIGTRDPLRRNDRPSDNFERRANNLALTAGTPLTGVEQIDHQWFYRRSVPLTNFDPSCAKCHINYKPFASTERVGALVLRIPIKPQMN